MADIKLLEEGDELNLDYKKLKKIAQIEADVVPVAVQNIDTKEVILIAYINELALKESIRTKIATFWSTSRNELWVKGKTSGEYFELLEVFVNCEQNSLVFKVRPKKGNICHTKNREGKARNCFYRKLDFNTMKLINIDP